MPYELMWGEEAKSSAGCVRASVLREGSQSERRRSGIWTPTEIPESHRELLEANGIWCSWLGIRGIQCERLGKDQPQSFCVPVLQHLGPATIFIIYPLQSRLWDIAGPLSRLHLRHPTKEFVHIFCVIQESRSKLQEVMIIGWCMGIVKCWSCCWGFLLLLLLLPVVVVVFCSHWACQTSRVDRFKIPTRATNVHQLNYTSSHSQPWIIPQ